MKDEIIVISLGGSLIVPDEVDIAFLNDFKQLISSQISLGKKFVIITGGGKVCRRYQDAAKQVAQPSDEDLDWIGIASLKLNAELVRVVFGNLANKEVVANLGESFSFESAVVVGSAYKPGHSTDWDAVLAAKNIGAKKVINMSNIDYVYDADPKKNPDAKKIEQISWADYRALIPTDWNPGLNSPFDPIASKMAQEEGIEVAIMNGKPIDNLVKYLNGEKFAGTVIS